MFDAEQARANTYNYVDVRLKEILYQIEKESKAGYNYYSCSDISDKNFEKLILLGFSIVPDKDYPNHYYITW
jgi:hypothetical protein